MTPKPLIFVGINGWLLFNKDAPGTHFGDHVIQRLHAWSQVAELRWLSVWSAADIQNTLVPSLALPDIAVGSNPDLLPDADCKRPILILREYDSRANFYLLRSRCKHRYSIIERDSDALPVCLAMAQLFLDNLGVTRANVRLIMQPTVDRNLTEDSKQITGCLDGIDNILSATQLRDAILTLPVVAPFIEHLKDHLAVIELDTELPNNNVLARLTFGRPIAVVYPVRLTLNTPCIRNDDCPLIWLDVDGVLNAQGSLAEFKQEFPDAVQSNCMCRSQHFPIVYSPSVVAKINAWADVAEIRWLTMWTTEARYRLAPHIGLRDFEVCSFQKHQARLADVHKPSDLQRPLVWIEDEQLDRQVGDIIQNQTCFVQPPVLTYLTRAHLETVDAFLKQFKK